jgi:hypothetical protein
MAFFIFDFVVSDIGAQAKTGCNSVSTARPIWSLKVMFIDGSFQEASFSRFSSFLEASVSGGSNQSSGNDRTFSPVSFDVSSTPISSVKITTGSSRESCNASATRRFTLIVRSKLRKFSCSNLDRGAKRINIRGPISRIPDCCASDLNISRKRHAPARDRLARLTFPSFFKRSSSLASGNEVAQSSSSNALHCKNMSYQGQHLA